MIRLRMARTGPLAAVALVVLTSTSCRKEKGPSAALPSPPPTVVVAMDDYRFDHPARIPAGRVVFSVPNAGAVYHRLTLLPLEDDSPSIHDQIHDDEAQVFSPFAGTRAELPGQTGDFAVDLVAGQRYAMICTVRTPEGKAHAEIGMASEFRAGGGPVPKPKQDAPPKQD